MHPHSSGPRILTISENPVLRIAIVDDEVDLGDLYSKILRRVGYSAPRVYRDGDSIVEAIVRDGAAFDVILVDFRMPGMNGIEASRIILKHRPETKIVLVTANDSVQEEALTLGLYFLQKPFSMKTLEQVMKRLEALVKETKQLEKESQSP